MFDKNDRQFFMNKHKREVLWQVWLPVGFGSLAMLALGCMAALSLQTGTDSSTRWGHVATIWLILPLFLVGFFTLVILVAITFGVAKLTGILPGYAAIIQDYIKYAALRVQTLADRSIQPVIDVRTRKTALHRFWVAIRYLILGGFRD